jgi:hypothetical protein
LKRLLLHVFFFNTFAKHDSTVKKTFKFTFTCIFLIIKFNNDFFFILKNVVLIDNRKSVNNKTILLQQQLSETLSEQQAKEELQEQLHFPDNIANVVIEEGITAEFVTYNETDGGVVEVGIE